MPLPAHPFKVYTVEGETPRTYIGGSYDNLSAVVIAATMSQILRIPTAVLDEVDAIIAYIGWDETPPTQE